MIAIDGGEWLKGAGQFDFLKLPVRNAPYWCVLSPSVALGYRKGARGGAWLARLHDDETGKRVQEKIGKADDTLDADGDAIGQREGVVDAIRATHAETDEDIANIGEDEAMTRRALELLRRRVRNRCLMPDRDHHVCMVAGWRSVADARRRAFFGHVADMEVKRRRVIIGAPG